MDEGPYSPTQTPGRYKGLFVEEFPDPRAGAPSSRERLPPEDLDAYMRSCGPLADPDNFEAAEILMTSGLSNADKDRHLKSKRYIGTTPWGHCDAMLADIDKLAHGPEFKLDEVDMHNGRGIRPQYMVLRNIIDIIRDFLADQSFREHIRYKPWRLYISADKKVRIYGDMSASDWWWKEMEKMIQRGIPDATIVPIIIATDQTTLSVMCGGQKAYPVYVSFGNLDKDWRRKPSKRGMYLLGYLPVDSFEDVPNDDERRRLKADLVHRALEKMLMPLRKASQEGVEMWCPDGCKRRIYPRVAAYTADWPEQNLQACTSEGGCPICKTPYSERGSLDKEAELRERAETLDALRKYFLRGNVCHLKPFGLKPVWPWWGDIPDVNLSTCFTPDLLHQTYQGVFKTHLVRWMKKVIGVDILDDRFSAMPRAEGLTHFSKGITAVGQWTGRQSKQLLAQFLPTVVGGLTPELANMVRVLVDFMYQAHASSLTDLDLTEMEKDLRTFHELKELLVIRGVYESEARFNMVPKLHMLRHWVQSIRELGTPDGYNTEAPEHLHIEYAKVPWRASNKVKPLEQMVTYIQRQEAIRKHRHYLDRYLGVDQGPGETPDGNECEQVGEELEQVGDGPNGDGESVQPVRSAIDVRASAPVLAAGGRVKKAAVWDVAMYLEKPNRLHSSEDIYEKHGIERFPAPGVWLLGYRAGRVRALFTLPEHLRFYYPGQLAYLELFTPFDASAPPFTKLHSTKPDYDSKGVRRTLVVPVTDIIFATHLVPKFHMLNEEIEINQYVDLLDLGRNFWLNHYYNHHFYQFIQHWRHRRPGLQERLVYNAQRTQQLGRPEGNGESSHRPSVTMLV
ncbi:unnamed protein product [Rhizoctonia solani]|uniref:Uncharacterized protein n=1 Tax=Rhizoctonia solani TaxID=456999 RepID=A0A8H3HTQ1_9AGAM|nr:unnamed protein product [Rhizoctonia solani]